MQLHWVCAAILALVVLLPVDSGALPAIVPSGRGWTRSLDGVWRFKLEQAGADTSSPRRIGARDPITTPATFEHFFTPDYPEDGAWRDVQVPGNWEMAGFSPATYNQPDNASGFYRKWFQVPASWKGRSVLINFDGVMCGCEVWVNGKPAQVSDPSWGRSNYHESGWTAWQVDLTPHVRFGAKNLLALRVTKNTQSSDLDSGDYFFLGGVYRPVTLFSVPETHIRDLAVTTRLLADGRAEVRVRLQTVGGSATASARLGDLAAAGEQTRGGEAEIAIPVERPRLWTAEHPDLYPLQIELRDSQGKLLETISRRIGIREITIEKGIFKVNGVPVKMTGICRHDVYLPSGTAVGHDLWRKDLKLMKEANINAIRTSHYPYGSGFYDLCDEMGFYVLDELPYCWCPTDDPELTPAYLQRARETIRRDRNHACVVIWAIGNENRPGINQKLVADAVRELDTTRPRLNSERPADENGVEFDDRHYTAHETMARQAGDSRRDRWPLIFTENPNVWDVRLGADYGCLDAWAPVLSRCWDDLTWTREGICGGFLWEWQDRAVIDAHPAKLYQHDAATGVNYVKTKGLVDGWRHPRPDYYHVKMVYSPIRVSNKADLAARPGYAILDVTNRYQFTNLSEIRITWRLLKGARTVGRGTARADVPPWSKGTIAIKLPADTSADVLMVAFDHPGGWNVVTSQFPLSSIRRPAGRPMNLELPEGLRFPRLNLVARTTRDDPFVWRRVERIRGSLINAKSESAISGSPHDMPLAAIRSLEADIVLQDNPAKPVARLKAGFRDGRFSYRLDWTGGKTDIQEIGWVFEMPAQFDHFSWDRQALWSYYPETHIGRPAGTATPDSATAHVTSVSRPDAFDFNSTKYNCNRASLADSGGHGLAVEMDPRQRHHCRAELGPDGGYSLVVNRQCSPPRDISTPQVPEMYLELSAGETVSGSFRVGSQ